MFYLLQLTKEETTISESAIGGNKSAEDEGEGDAESAAVHGVNIVIAYRLVETGYTKKQYQTELKVHIITHLLKMLGRVTQTCT